MAATVYLSETNGPSSGPVTTANITNINFSNVDTPNTTVSATQNPLVIPVSGTYVSLTKWIRICVHAWGGSTQIGNLKVWRSAGTWATTIGLGANTNYATFNLAASIVASYGYKMGGGLITVPDSVAAATNGITWQSLVINPSPVQNLTIASSLSTNLLSSGGADQYSNFIIMGIWWTSSQPTGDAGAQTVSYAWDES